MENILMKISGAYCERCEQFIETVLLGLQGVREAKADLTQKFIHVEFDPTEIGQTGIKDIMQKIGYPVLD